MSLYTFLSDVSAMNVLQKAFKIEKNHVTDINEFCMVSSLGISDNVILNQLLYSGIKLSSSLEEEEMTTSYIEGIKS